MSNTKKSFGTPPKNRGPRANGKMLRQISKYCFALAAYTSRATPKLSQQLKDTARELDVFADTANKKIDIYPSIYALQGCLVNIKAAIDLGTDYAEAISRLIDEKKSLIELLRAGVDSLEDKPFQSKAIKRFIANKRQVEITYTTAQVNLRAAQQARAQSAKVWEASCSVLKSITAGLNQLESFTTVSPSLAKKINRVVKPKQLADFFDEPMRAQQESLKMHARICLIIKNVTEALRDVTAFETVENAQTEKLSHVVAPKETLEPTLNSNRIVKNNFNDDDSNDDSTGAVSVG